MRAAPGRIRKREGLSKIFDALRKAERERSGGKQKGKGRSRTPQRPDEEREKTFLRGTDPDFRRSLLNLRNSIDSAMKGVESRVIMFTSAVRGEGKTTITAFLARLLALGESDRVLLVDCAVDGPEVHVLFGVENDKGILDLLSGEAEFDDVVRPVDEGVLDVISLGKKRGADITQPMFNSSRMDGFVKQAAERYDYVLLDTSAVLEAPETPIIGSYATGTVIIVKAASTKREVIKRAMMMIEKLDGRFIGTVLNRKKYYIPEFIYRRV